jgi:D-aspartate ligase
MASSAEVPESMNFGRGARDGQLGSAGAPSSPPGARAVRGKRRGNGQSLPPVILLGGESNVLSVAGSLALAGIRVYAINRPGVSSLYSRHLTRITVAGDNSDARQWRDYLLSDASNHLNGAVIMCCGDEAISLVIQDWQAFSERYVLEPCPPKTRLKLLDKLSTYESASACGVAHPRFWRLEPGEGTAEVARICRFPVIVKPRLSQHWRLVGRKYLRADNTLELKRQYDRYASFNIAVIAMEFIPGADDRYCSYYTYIDQDGAPLFHFTKRVVRRHPVNEGGTTYHITDWNPEVAEKGLRLFQHVGLRGLGNIEFKRDPRDGELKLIEVNARYTAGNAVVTLSGIDQALLSYSQLTGWPYETPHSYRKNLVMWDPIPDYLAFHALHLRREITLWQWLRQVGRADTTPLYDLRDPLPGLHHVASTAIAAVKHLYKRSRVRRRNGAEAPSSIAPIKR